MVCRIAILLVVLPAVAGCSFNLLEQDPPRDVDGDGRASFNDLHAPRSDAGFPPPDTDTRDYGETLSDHMDLQRGGSQYRDE